jgi:hypothetical protein
MVFINLIMVAHGKEIADRPLMNSMTAKRYKSADIVHSRGGY